mgnify:CR=1 FL=1
MKITQSNFNKLLDKNFLFEQRPKIVAATSGGPDSMALVFLLNEWIKIKKGSLVALIVDHQLRLESSDESKTVQKYLLSKKIKSKILKVKKTKISKRNMNEARENRFGQLINYCKKNNLLHLFIAHHLNDNIETFLLRKISGSNIEGLRSMQKIVYLKNIQILRPLLKHSKKEIIKFNDNKKIFFVDDPSNYNLKYSRSVVRNFMLINRKYNKQIKNDFESILNYFPKYRKMIFQILHELIIKVSAKKVSVLAKDFFDYDREIQIKIIELIYKFLMPNKKFLRYKKILDSILKLKINDEFKINLGGMHMKKDQFLINFSY